MIEIDFETDAIEPRPKYPPRPVGVAIGWPGHGGRRYYAWGHPVGNNCTKAQAVKVLKAAYKSGDGLLFHNAGFDLDVAETHLGLPLPPWPRIHDTLFLAFLNNPYEQNLSLKPLADKYLDMPPDEQTELKDWIMANVRKPDGGRIAPSQWGAYIAKAPGDLVGRYAIGDIKRTGMLYRYLWPLVRGAKMQEAYDRERRFLIVKLGMERRGVPVDAGRLAADTKLWSRSLEQTDDWLRTKLKAPGLDLDSNEDLADALEAAGKVKEWILTAKGNRSVAKKAIAEVLEDPEILSVMNYRGRLATCVRNFARPWLRMAEDGGRIYCSWNQVRNNESGKNTIGARTGRLSSSPNFQNVPKHPDLLAFSKSQAKRMQRMAEALEVMVLMLPPSMRRIAIDLPNLRDYIIAGKGRKLNIRDYSQQELRILGHFEGAVLQEAYREDPTMDIHDLARTLINEMLMTNYPRKPIKNTGFGLIYGMGVGKLAGSINTDVDTARRLKDAYLSIFPGMKNLIKQLNHRARRGEPFRTWGGRVYYCEPERKIEGKMRNFAYKQLNTLIQGSAADNTKEAAIRYNDIAQDGELLISVHDEFITSAPDKAADHEMELLRQAMEGVEFDVLMLSDGKQSATSWAAAEKYNGQR